MPCKPVIAGDGFISSMIISNDEYADLIEAKTQLDLIVACAGDDGYGAAEIIKAVKKAREPVITVAKAQE